MGSLRFAGSAGTASLNNPTNRVSQEKDNEEVQLEEKELIKRSFRGPVTREMIGLDLLRLGVGPGMTLIAHVSQSALGWVLGGPQTLFDALRDVLTYEGTLIMATYTSWNSDPSEWTSPPVPEDWIPIIKKHMPAFDPGKSMTKHTMGINAEYFRSLSGVHRSSHPRASFAAWGKHAAAVTENHSLDFPFGEESPMARAYERDAGVIIIGSSYDHMSSWYLSAYRAIQKYPEIDLPVEKCASVIIENGKRTWKNYVDYQRKHDDFDRIGEAFEAHFPVKKGVIGHAESRFFSQVDAVDFAEKWISEHWAPAKH